MVVEMYSLQLWNAEISGNFDVYEKMLISHIAAGVHGDQIGNNLLLVKTG